MCSEAEPRHSITAPILLQAQGKPPLYLRPTENGRFFSKCFGCGLSTGDVSCSVVTLTVNRIWFFLCNSKSTDRSLERSSWARSQLHNQCSESEWSGSRIRRKGHEAAGDT